MAVPGDLVNFLFCSSLQAANPGEEGAESVAKYGIKIPDPAPSRGDDEGGGPYEQLAD